MASRARSVCPPSSASMPSLASELQLPPLRPRRSISSSSSRSFWGEISGERPLMSDLRSEEHTSELQSQSNLVCRLLLEKKKLNAHTKAAAWLRQAAVPPRVAIVRAQRGCISTVTLAEKGKRNLNSTVALVSIYWHTLADTM